jgi:hypothetical protein
MNLRKLVQRRFLSFLASRWGMVVCLVGALFLLNTCVSLLHHFLAAPPAAALLSAPAPLPDRSSSPAHYSAYGAPIDIVYTWVNGSDPRLVQGKAPLPPSLSLSLSAPLPPPLTCLHRSTQGSACRHRRLSRYSPHTSFFAIFFCYFFFLFPSPPTRCMLPSGAMRSYFIQCRRRTHARTHAPLPLCVCVYIKKM